MQIAASNFSISTLGSRFTSQPHWPGAAVSSSEKLHLEEYPRWAEIVSRAFEVAPFFIFNDTTSTIEGVLMLLHEQTLKPWGLTIIEGNAVRDPLACTETRYHLEQGAGPSSWSWEEKHNRKQASETLTDVQRLLEPSTVAEHALLLGSSHGAITAYKWGGGGYFVVLRIAGVRIGIRDIPSVPNANEILIHREAFESKTLDRISHELLLEVFGRDPLAEQYDASVDLIDDKIEGLSGVPSVFFRHPQSNVPGIFSSVLKQLKQEGQGREEIAWNKIRASDQYRFNDERIRELVIPTIFDEQVNGSAGAAMADVLLLLGLSYRIALSSKPVEAPGLLELPQLAIKHAVKKLLAMKRDGHQNIEVNSRLSLLAQAWAHINGKAPEWMPVENVGPLKKVLDDFFLRIKINAHERPYQ